MAVAVPKRATAPAPAPSRTTPPRRKPAAPKRKPAPKPKRRAGGQLIPLAGRTAVAVGQFPDSGLMVRMTRGRLWIGVLGVLLAGVVALNVATLSFAATLGQITEQITAMEKDASVTAGREAQRYSTERIRYEGGIAGLAMPTTEEPLVLEAGPHDVATAAARLAAAE